MNIKYIIGLVIIVAFGWYAATSFQSSITPYVSIAEAKTSGDVVQVKGERVDGGNFDMENNVFVFTLKDTEGEQIEVIYDGAKPGNFEQAQEIVCIGEYRGGKFHARNILVKCPSKYEEVQQAGGQHPESVKL